MIIKHQKQKARYDCGIECIFNLLTTYNIDITHEAIHKKLGGSSFGVSLKEITVFFHSIAIKNDIIKVKSYLNDFDYKVLKHQIVFPIFALIETGEDIDHFVVLYKTKRGRLILSDPSLSSVRQVNLDYLSKVKYFLQFSNLDQKNIKSSAIDKHSETINVMKQRIKRLEYIKIVSITLVSSLFSLVSVFVLGAIVNAFVSSQNLLNVILLVIGLGVILLIKVRLNILRDMISNSESRSFEDSLYMSLTKNIISQTSETFLSVDYIERFNSIFELSNYLFQVLVSTFSEVIIVLLIFMYFTLFNFSVFLISFGLASVFTIYIFFNLKIFYIKNQGLIEKNVENAHKLDEYVSMKSSVMNFDIQSYLHDRLVKPYLKYSKNLFQMTEFKILFSSLFEIISSVSNIFVTFFIIVLVSRGELSIGEMVIVSSLTGLLLSNLGSVLLKQQSTERAKLIVKRLDEINIDYEPIKDDLSIDKIETLVLKNITIKIGENILLENLSFVFDFSVSNIYYLNGLSGVGKTTLMKCIVGDVKETSGHIIFNETIHEQSNRRRLVSYISNKESFFEDTIYNNIVMGREIDFSYLLYVIEGLGISDFTTNTKFGLSTIMRENGSNFSTGQCQRIALARVVVSNIKLIILDEALSNIDDESENKIISFLTEEGFRILVISHKNYNNQYSLKISGKGIISKNDSEVLVNE